MIGNHPGSLPSNCVLVLAMPSLSKKIRMNCFLNWTRSEVVSEKIRGYVDISLTLFIVICVVVVMIAAAAKWRLIQNKTERSF